MNKIRTYLKESMSELLYKVTWPTWKETWLTTVMVFIMVVLIMIFFFVVDTALGFGVRLLLGI